MRELFTLSARGGAGARLRAAAAGDLETLRLWRNANRTAFFCQEEISPQAQRRWHEGYLARQDDALFIVEAAGRPAGCAGARRSGGETELYNVMAAPGARVPGAMSGALLLLCSWAADHHGAPVGCRVLRGNPARAFYESLGFRLVEERPDHARLRLPEGFARAPYERRPA